MSSLATTESTSTAAARRAAMLQPKLTVNRPGDAYEQEADRVADRVVTTGRSPAAVASVAGGDGSIRAAAAVPRISRLQRQGSEEEEPQAHVQRQEEGQARLQRQAETEEETLQRQPQEEEEELQARVQRQIRDEEDPVQARRVPSPRPDVADKQQFPTLGRVEDTLYASKGGGEPLPGDLRIEMEVDLGADLTDVRIHTGAAAHSMTREINAEAFTHGRDIYFSEGKYDPDSLRGRRLLAHELTHVVQQGAAKQKLAPEEVRQSNAAKDAPLPDPRDTPAVEAEVQTEETVQEATAATEEQKKAETQFDEAPSATPPTAQPHAEGSAAPAPSVAPGTTESAPGGKIGDAPEAQDPAKKPTKKEAPAEQKTAGVATGAKGAAKSPKDVKTKGAGVGAYLRQTTKAAVESKRQKLTKVAQAMKTKDPASEKLKQAEKAQEPPAGEAASQARGTKVKAVDEASPPTPGKEKAKQELDRAMEQALPATLKEVDSFKEEGRGRIVGNAVAGVVTTDTNAVQATYEEVDNPPEPEPPPEPQALPPVEPAPPAPAVNLGDGVVGEVQPEHTDLSPFEAESDTMLEEEGITQEQLDRVDNGDLAEAKKERAGIKQTVREAPNAVKSVEKREKARVQQELANEEAAGKAQMEAERQNELQATKDKQQSTKTALEQKRAAVAAKINGIYETANQTVKEKLEALQTQSLKRFDEGQKKATTRFEDNVNRRIEAFKDERYGGATGWTRWLHDKLLGMDDLPQVKRIFEDEKATFVAEIDRLVASITKDNERVIEDCRTIVATARTKIEEFVASLGPELRQTGQQATSDMKAKLDALDKKVEAKREELQQTLEEKQSAAIEAIEKKIEAMKEEMSGALARLGSLLLNAALKFFKWALSSAGYSPDAIMGILDKGKAVLTAIVREPVPFVKNLVGAVKKGVLQFKTNIKQHLVGGLIEWLTGALSSVPIQLPDTWNLKGILSLVLQILGLTYDRIRAKLVKRVGEKVVSAIETGVTIVRRLITEGPIALWHMLKEKAAEIKQQVMDGIRTWVITNVVKQGIIKLLSFLNPAGALVQAVLAIYNTIMFFVENRDRIVQFVKSVFTSIGDIAQGRLGAAASYVEQTLARTIPIILGFIARLLGLSGIGTAITKVIEKIRRPVDKVVDKVLDKIVAMGRKLWAKAKAGVGKLKDKVVQWWKKDQSFTDKSGEGHKIFLKKSGRRTTLMLASAPEQMRTRLKALRASDDVPPARKKKLTTAIQHTTDLEALLQKLDAAGARSRTDKRNEAEIDTLTAELDAKMKTTADVLKDISLQEEADLASLPTPKYSFTTTGGKAKTAEVEYLTANRPMGAEPGADPQGWAALQQGLTTSGQHWRRMHLVNHRLGGPGTAANLAPGTQKNNSTHEKRFESKLKEKVGDMPGEKKRDAVLWMTGEVTYRGKEEAPANWAKTYPGGTEPDVTDFPKAMSFQSGTYEKDDDSYEKNGGSTVATVDIDVPLPNWTLVETPSLQSASPRRYRGIASSHASDADAVFTDYVVNRIIKAKSYGSAAEVKAKLQKEAGNAARQEQTRERLRRAANILHGVVQAGKMQLD